MVRGCEGPSRGKKKKISYLFIGSFPSGKSSLLKCLASEKIFCSKKEKPHFDDLKCLEVKPKPSFDRNELIYLFFENLKVNPDPKFSFLDWGKKIKDDVQVEIEKLKKEQAKKVLPSIILLLVRMFKWKVEFEQKILRLKFQKNSFRKYFVSCDFHKEFVIYLK
jgi:predicted nucleic acid binding AN1-type Zn finger protein